MPPGDGKKPPMSDAILMRRLILDEARRDALGEAVTLPNTARRERPVAVRRRGLF
jgi:hypothetical protein